MDFSDERYVRLYTRVTADEASWCWQARALWPLLLRRADRTGIVEVSQPRRVAKLSGLVMLPTEVVEPGLRDLLDDTCVGEFDKGYVIRNFIEAQETPANNRKRQEDKNFWRKQRSLQAQSTVRPSPPRELTRNVSSRHVPLLEASNEAESAPTPPESTDTKRVKETRNGAEETRNVSKRHALTRDDTPYRAVPSSLRAVGEMSDVAGGQAGSDERQGSKEVSAEVTISKNLNSSLRNLPPPPPAKSPRRALAAKASRLPDQPTPPPPPGPEIALWAFLLGHEKTPSGKPSTPPKDLAAQVARMLAVYPLGVHKRAAMWLLRDSSTDKPYAGTYLKSWESACASVLANEAANAKCGKCGDEEEEAFEMYDRRVCRSCEGLFEKWADDKVGDMEPLFHLWFDDAKPPTPIRPPMQNAPRKLVDVKAMQKQKRKAKLQ